jgi:hypothetical protein
MEPTMRLHDDFTPGDPLDDEVPLGDGVADVDALVHCPYCGEGVEIALDPGSGAAQRYVEDCEVCCRPWQVTAWREGGRLRVQVSPAG